MKNQKTLTSLFVLLMLMISCIAPRDSSAQPVVGLDNWFNRETNAKTGEPYHYLWTDTAWSGYSRLGDIFKLRGAQIATVEKPLASALSKIDVYIIVDPDTTTESKSPNYILAEDAKAIKAALSSKLGISEENLNFSVSQKTATNAKGNVREKTSEVGGGYWLAAKTDSGWQIVYDGQSTPTCSQIAPYNFPTSMVPECLNSSGNVVQR